MPPSTTSAPDIEIDAPATQLARVKRLVDMYASGAIPRLAQHEVHPDVTRGSRENYLYFTLPVCINFQRNSPAMWASALATWEDRETRFVYYPEQLAERSVDDIRAALTKHKLALQPNKHVHIWTTIAAALHDYYADDPRQVIAEAGHDAGGLIRLLQVTHRARFPYLSGPKLSNYWPYILLQYTNVELANTHEISIIPDTHVLQCSERLGVVPAGASPRAVEEAWRNLLVGSGLTPAQVHPVLWHWSRNHFMPVVD